MFPWNHQISRLNPDMSILALVMELTKLPCYQAGQTALAIIMTEIKSSSK